MTALYIGLVLAQLSCTALAVSLWSDIFNSDLSGVNRAVAIAGFVAATAGGIATIYAQFNMGMFQ